MTVEAEQELRGLAGSRVTEEQMQRVLAGWGEVFQRLQLTGDEQFEEIKGTMRARVLSGSISIVAPSLP